jgi:hypothetical protein
MNQFNKDKNPIYYKNAEEIENKKNIISILKKFRQDKEVKLMSEECYITPIGDIIFFFGEQGGQNESDTQGWSRDYTFTLDSNFIIINANYSQG